MPFARLADRFQQQAAGCADMRELGRLVEAATIELGFAWFALLHHRALKRPGQRLIRLDNYPQGWEAELNARGLVGHDPVHLASVRSNTGFAWADLPRLTRLGPLQREILERSARFGIGAGFTVPVNVPGEPSGSCSFALRPGRELPAERLLCAETVGAHAFRAARRIEGHMLPGRPPHLSRRERQCLRLVARGKTDWEIAAILGLSVETVRQYVKRARGAYDVVSRTQLVVHGLRDALISFDEAIPPSG